MLTKVKGVESVEVDFDNKTATCTVTDAVDPAALAKAVSGQYSATVKP